MVVTPENHVAQIVRETLACGGTHQRRQEGSLNVVHGFQFILHRLGSDVARVFHRDRTAVASLVSFFSFVSTCVGGVNPMASAGSRNSVGYLFGEP